MQDLKGIHFLLTYCCNYECDHCFLYCGPNAEGTFTLAQIRAVLDEAEALGTVEEVYFEGGEPFLYFPLLVEGIRLARARGLRAGLVTNSYWATAREDAGLWLGQLRDAGLDEMTVSDDEFHGSGEESPARRAAAVAREVGLPCGAICIEAPAVASPRRVHVDSLGNVHLCQGVSMGNMWETPLSRLVREYEPEAHPICGPLIRGGPLALAREHGVPLEPEYVDACHLCFSVRRALLERFPEQLTPPQVYGISS